MSDLREHVQAIYDANGRLTPELVVETARPDDHPLHAVIFDRAPGEAAEAWYRERAHQLIRRVKVVYRKPDQAEPQHVRAFHAIRRPTGYTYEPIEKIANDPEAQELLRREMEREWRTLQRKYQDVEGFFEMVSADAGAYLAAA